MNYKLQSNNKKTIIIYLQKIQSILKSYSDLDDDNKIDKKFLLKEGLKIIEVLLTIKGNEIASKCFYKIYSPNHYDLLRDHNENMDEMQIDNNTSNVSNSNIFNSKNIDIGSQNNNYLDSKFSDMQTSKKSIMDRNIVSIRFNENDRENLQQDIDIEKLLSYTYKCIYLIQKTLETRINQYNQFNVINELNLNNHLVNKEDWINSNKNNIDQINRSLEDKDEIIRSVYKCKLNSNYQSNDIVINYISPNLIQRIKEQIIFPLLNPRIFTERRIGICKNVLLYGPPGCGKSQIWCTIQNIVRSSSRIPVSFFEVSSADLLSEWFGKSEKFVQALFKIAEQNSPSIIFFDEIDGLCSNRTGDSSDVSSRIKTEFLLRLSQLQTKNNYVSVIAATNLPWKIDPAIRRRFQSRIYVKLPDEISRKNIIIHQLENIEHKLTEADINNIVIQTDQFSISDLVNFMSEVKYNPLRRMQNSSHFSINERGNWIIQENTQESSLVFDRDILTDTSHNIEVPAVEFGDIPFKLFKPSNIKDELLQYENFHETFGTF